MIRPAGPDDIPALQRLLEQLHGRSPVQAIDVDWAAVLHMLGASIAQGSTFVDEEAGRIYGFIIAAVMPLWWNTAKRVGQDVFFYSKRIHMGEKLLHEAARWCKAHGATWLQFGISSFRSVDSVAAIYLSAGFRREGSFFVMEV